MLVLSRRVGESIQIGDDVTVTVLNCNGNHIRIGIAAPQSIAVNRQEVYLRNKGAEQEKSLTKEPSGGRGS